MSKDDPVLRSRSLVFRTSAFASVLVSQVWLFVSYFQLMQRRAKETEQSKEPDADFDDEPEFETKPKRTPRSNYLLSTFFYLN